MEDVEESQLEGGEKGKNLKDFGSLADLLLYASRHT